MAGVAGLEPANARIKTLCLTGLATPHRLVLKRLLDLILSASVHQPELIAGFL